MTITNFQCGPEPEDVLAAERLSDGRILGLFRKPGDQAELVITKDAMLPELWQRLRLFNAEVLQEEFHQVFRSEEGRIAKEQPTMTHRTSSAVGTQRVACTSCHSADFNPQGTCNGCGRRVCLYCGCTTENPCQAWDPKDETCLMLAPGRCSFCVAPATPASGQA